jgi:hypothetical protein
MTLEGYSMETRIKDAITVLESLLASSPHGYSVICELQDSPSLNRETVAEIERRILSISRSARAINRHRKLIASLTAK